jgi:hypothetical protein
MKTTHSWRLAICSGLLVAQGLTAAEVVYYHLPLSALKLTEGTLPVHERSWSGRRWQLLPAMQSYAVLDGPGEVYVDTSGNRPWMPLTLATAGLSIQAPRDTEISGRLYVPTSDMNGMVQLKFKVPPGEMSAGAKSNFFEAKLAHYQQLGSRNLPGAAWFRHQALAAAKELGRETNSGIDAITGLPSGAPPRWRESEFEDTYDLFTGGRALSENLQLDRVLPSTKVAEDTVYVTNLAGISVKEMNWKELIKDAKPELDPLAAFIPADQHAIFFPSFQAMTQLIDEADADGTPVLQWLEPRSEDAGTRTRYQRQLCLGLSELARMLGPQVVASVAFTGSDPFLRVGSDPAILFEARNPDLLKSFLTAQQSAAQKSNPAAKPVKGEINGVSYTGLVSPDRAVSVYMASVSNVVLVSNSRYQLEALVRVARGLAAPLNSQDEYRFFRSRYPRADRNETAFVVLPDAAIRRWCGPQWRIADSRRTRAAAVLSELEAAHLEELVSGKVREAVLAPGFNVPDAGEFRLTPAGVTCATYGGLDFMTPIAEIPLSRGTRAEADAYERWRDSYQRNWRQFFDPIAIRFSLAPDSLGAALTVTPLIMASDYRHFIDFSSGAQIAPDAGDPHTNTVLHLVFAINAQAPSVQEAGNFIGNMAPGLKANGLGWLGQSIAVYAEDDPFWDRLRQATNTDTFLESNFTNLPLALHVEVKNPLGLAGFLTALHAFVDQSAPGMTSWQNLEYQGQAYVKVTSREQGEKPWSLYYAASPRALIVTLNEPLLKRALDRQSSRAGTDPKDLKSPAVRPWLGKNLCAAAERTFFDVFGILTRDTDQTRRQLLAWNNLPILNEWKRLYPDKDPVKLHEQVWGIKLVCPGGGAYVWNESWHTMESTVFGHPGQPKGSPNLGLLDILSARLGVTFEYQGLSANGVLTRRPQH